MIEPDKALSTTTYIAGGVTIAADKAEAVTGVPMDNEWIAMAGLVIMLVTFAMNIDVWLHKRKWRKQQEKNRLK